MPFPTMRNARGLLVPCGQGGIVQSGAVPPSPTLPVTANLSLWLDAGTLPLSDGQAVTTWADGSGSGRTGTGFNGPIYGSNVVNGRPTVRLNGYNMCINGPANSSFAIPHTLCIVYRSNALYAGATHDSIANTGGTTNELMYSRTTLTGLFGSCSISGPVLANGVFAITIAAFTNPTASIVANGVVTASGACSTGGVTTSQYIVGALDTTGSRAANCDVAEVLVYTGALTSAQRRSIELYFSTKYAIPLSGPS